MGRPTSTSFCNAHIYSQLPWEASLGKDSPQLTPRGPRFSLYASPQPLELVSAFCRRGFNLLWRTSERGATRLLFQRFPLCSRMPNSLNTEVKHSLGVEASRTEEVAFHSEGRVGSALASARHTEARSPPGRQSERFVHSGRLESTRSAGRWTDVSQRTLSLLVMVRTDQPGA